MKTELENLIDTHSLSDVLTALGEVCEEKGNHLRHNWQDTASAKVWEHAAHRLHKLACDVEV